MPMIGGYDASDVFSMGGDSGCTIELLDRQENEEAGINHASIAIRGMMADGHLKGEEGSIVWLGSAFNSEGQRQTSFAAVSVSPEIDDSIDIDIQDKDVREDRYEQVVLVGSTSIKQIARFVLPMYLPIQWSNVRMSVSTKPSDCVEDVAGKVSENRRRASRGRRSEKYETQARTVLGLRFETTSCI